MANNQKLKRQWETRQLGNCFIKRSHAGWVVSVLPMDSVTGPFDYLVPFESANGQRRRSLAARLKRQLQNTITGLGDVRRISARGAADLMRLPNLGRLWRGRARWYPPGPGNWNGRGKLCPVRSHSGLSYCVLRTDRGWLVMLRSVWGNPCGTYLVPFDKVPFRGKTWDEDFFLRPLRWHISHIHGARKMRYDELARLSGWDDEVVFDKKAA